MKNINTELQSQFESESDNARNVLFKLFPSAFADGNIDFGILKQLLGNAIDETDEKYSTTWHGKRRARQSALVPSNGTLRPAADESVDWNTSQNLLIEGDNLEVLKLLQKSYHAKIKMIYIDPPYNTGNEFIYPDDYAENLTTYLQYTGQVDAEGKKFTSNTEASGRFHSRWMNMMLPRLFLARNLMTEDGVIFISIDDHELVNLLKIADEVFGEENRLGILTIVSNLKGRSDDKYFATAHNYLLAYQKSNFSTLGVPLPEQYWEDYPETAEDGRRFRLQGLRKRGSGSKREDRPNMYYPIYASEKRSDVSLSKSSDFPIEVLPKLSDGTDGRWRWGKDTVGERITELMAKSVGPDKRLDIFQIDFAEGEAGVKRIKPKTFWIGPEFANEAGTLDVKSLFKAKVFDSPKPLGLIKQCLEQATTETDMVLDFFAGSGTTGHAVMAQNALDGGKRRFILVQLPEPLDPEIKEQKVAAQFCDQLKRPRNIAELTKERLRRAATAIKEENPDYEGDLGYRVFRLDSSNIKEWTPNYSDLNKALLDSIEHLNAGRSETDILFELLLKLGLDLNVSIEKRTIAGKTVYSVGFGILLVCLDLKISAGDVEQLAHGMATWCKELNPIGETTCVFRDSAFADDVVKTNLSTTLEQNGLEKVRSL